MHHGLWLLVFLLLNACCPVHIHPASTQAAMATVRGQLNSVRVAMGMGTPRRGVSEEGSGLGLPLPPTTPKGSILANQPSAGLSAGGAELSGAGTSSSSAATASEVAELKSKLQALEGEVAVLGRNMEGLALPATRASEVAESLRTQVTSLASRVEAVANAQQEQAAALAAVAGSVSAAHHDKAAASSSSGDNTIVLPLHLSAGSAELTLPVRITLDGEEAEHEGRAREVGVAAASAAAAQVGQDVQLPAQQQEIVSQLMGVVEALGARVGSLEEEVSKASAAAAAASEAAASAAAIATAAGADREGAAQPSVAAAASEEFGAALSALSAQVGALESTLGQQAAALSAAQAAVGGDVEVLRSALVVLQEEVGGLARAQAAAASAPPAPGSPPAVGGSFPPYFKGSTASLSSLEQQYTTAPGMSQLSAGAQPFVPGTSPGATATTPTKAAPGGGIPSGQTGFLQRWVLHGRRCCIPGLCPSAAMIGDRKQFFGGPQCAWRSNTSPFITSTCPPCHCRAGCWRWCGARAAACAHSTRMRPSWRARWSRCADEVPSVHVSCQLIMYP